MANRPVVGSGPVPYLATSNKKFFLIPLSGLSFNDKGTIDSAPWEAAVGLSGEADRLKAVFADLTARGVLRPGKQFAPTLSFKFEAAATGVRGNGTAVTIAKVKPDTASPLDPTKTQFELTVAETAIFKLSYDTAAANAINKVLGSAATTPPPLVKLKADVGAPALPTKGTHTIASGASDVPIPASPGTAFTLTRTSSALTAPAITVTIDSVDPTAKTFTLTAVRALTRAVTVGGVTTAGQPDAEAVKHAVKVSIAPATGGTGVPPAGTYQLVGGSDPATVSAKPAALTVPAVL